MLVDLLTTVTVRRMHMRYGRVKGECRRRHITPIVVGEFLNGKVFLDFSLTREPRHTHQTNNYPTMAIQYFTPEWHRPRRKNDVVEQSTTGLAISPPFWHQYPCIICGKISDKSSENPKRCSRCKSTVYCSSACQKLDFGEGKHKSHCIALGKLWTEKKRLETCLWYRSDDYKCLSRSTNPFDDDYEEPSEQAKQSHHEHAIVGKFWYDQPQTPLQKYTTQYCVVLLQLVQLLGRAESWRVSRIVSGQRETYSSTTCWRDKALNTLSLELALDLAYTLLHLDRTDGRVRLLIPSLLLEGGYFQEAYNFMKFWTKANGCLMILDLALPGGAEDSEGNSFSSIEEVDEDIFESPVEWMDNEVVYPSLGMVFELAYLKCYMMILLRHKGENTTNANEQVVCQSDDLIARAVAVGKDELEYQVKLLLSVVHKWNSHLLPKLGNEFYDVCYGASSSTSRDKDLTSPRTPPALDSLLNLHPPGFELQYSFGNPGGGSVDEAVSIWQRDMLLWHVMNPLTMEYLSFFCQEVEANLIETNMLVGKVNDSDHEMYGTTTGLISREEQTKTVTQRKEAEDLVAKLRKENPDRTIDQIMMHPDMAALMIKHLHTS